jgi:hypothetical protein
VGCQLSVVIAKSEAMWQSVVVFVVYCLGFSVVGCGLSVVIAKSEAMWQSVVGSLFVIL